MLPTVSRRRIRRWLRESGRFYAALVLTVIVVAYIAVPWIVRLVEAIGGYSPVYYEPRDVERATYLKRTPGEGEGFLGWDVALKAFLLLLVGLVWLVAVPTPRWGGPRSSRR